MCTMIDNIIIISWLAVVLVVSNSIEKGKESHATYEYQYCSPDNEAQDDCPVRMEPSPF